jgi:hypothetical protein
MTRFLTTRHFAALIVPAILLGALGNTGCSGKYGRTAVQNDEGEPAKATGGGLSSLKMNDDAAKDQLVKGFYGVESGTWRWTAGSFSVLLKTPPGAAQKGATLTVPLAVSDVILKKVHSQTLTASIGGKALKSETYPTAGNHTFTADVPAASLTGDTVTIDFSLDNPLPPSPSDLRELGVIVTSVGLATN